MFRHDNHNPCLITRHQPLDELPVLRSAALVVIGENHCHVYIKRPTISYNPVLK